MAPPHGIPTKKMVLLPCYIEWWGCMYQQRGNGEEEVGKVSVLGCT